jgi:hypothetical protein
MQELPTIKQNRALNKDKKIKFMYFSRYKTDTVKIENKRSNANGNVEGWKNNSYHILSYILANLVIPFFDHTLKASEKYHSFYSEIYFFAKFGKKQQFQYIFRFRFIEQDLLDLF